MNSSQSGSILSPINVVARRTGLTAHVIRAWERRYGAIQPERAGTARRMYTDQEVSRLILLRQAVELGHRISEVAQLPVEELRALVGRETLPGVEATPRIPMNQSRLVETALLAAQDMDDAAFMQILLQATRSLSIPMLFESFIGPLLGEIGRGWRDGHFRVVHEHFVSAHLRTFLGDLLVANSGPAAGAVLVVTTPQGQHHELGALMSAVVASRTGWRVHFLGPSLPAEEIAFAVEKCRAQVLALSVAFPESESVMDAELRRLRGLLPGGVSVYVGGSGLENYRDALDQLGAFRVRSFADFSEQLSMRLQIDKPIRAGSL